MKKGFTLIELLAVIVIIGILTLISVTVVTNIIQSARLKSFNIEAENIERSAEMYAINNYILTSIEDGEEYTINIEDMEDYLDGVTDDMINESVIVSNIEGTYYYYYTGRDNY